jgi:hypothetical protein
MIELFKAATLYLSSAIEALAALVIGCRTMAGKSA